MTDVFRRCGCRDDEGKQLGAKCPQLRNAKHGTWAYYIGKTANGQRVRVRKGGFATKEAARIARNADATKLDKGTYREPGSETYAAYVRRWLDHHSVTGDGLKATTQVNYRRYVEADIAPSKLGAMKLSEIRRHHVGALVQELSRGRGPTTVRRIFAVVSGSLRAAFEDQLLDENPARGVRLPKVTTKPIEPWNPEDVGRFLDTANEHRLAALFELAMFTGLRRGELLGLRWSDIDLQGARLTVRANRTQAGRDVVEGAPKTDSGRRIVDLTDRASGALITWQFEQAAEAALWGTAYEQSGYVFTYENGSPLKPQYVTRLFDKLRVAAGLPKVTFHGQRHEAAALLIESGAELFVVSRILGHSSLSITSDHYGHLIGSASRRALDNAAALVPARGSVHTVSTQGLSVDMKKAPATA